MSPQLLLFDVPNIFGIFFEVVSLEIQTENGIIWEQIKEKRLLATLIRLSSEKLTDRLFVLKDIRGFEKERFYIFKPNEKQFWHKAIAYLDVDDFMDAILKAGRDTLAKTKINCNMIQEIRKGGNSLAEQIRAKSRDK